MKQDAKEWTLSLIAAVRGEFEFFAAQIPKKERGVTGELKHWSTKDDIAHLCFWLEVFVKNIKSRRTGKTLISTSNYRIMNDQAWHESKDLSWSEIEVKLMSVFDEIEAEIKTLSLEEITDGNKFSVEPQRNPPRPLVKSLLYELVDHPFHHLVKIHRKLNNTDKANESLALLTAILKQPGFSKWTAAALNKIRKRRAFN